MACPGDRPAARAGRKELLGMGGIKKSGKWRLGMMGPCGIIPAQTLLAGGNCYTGISAKAQSTAQVEVCNHEGRQTPLLTTPRG